MRSTATILLAALVASMAPFPGHASISFLRRLGSTEKKKKADDDTVELSVSVSFKSNNKYLGATESASMMENLIIEACNAAYPPEDLHLYEATLQEETHHPTLMFLSDTHATNDNDNNGAIDDIDGVDDIATDDIDLVELAMEALAMEELVELVMDDDRFTEEEFRNAILDLRKSKTKKKDRRPTRNKGKVTPFSAYQYSFMFSTEVHCGPGCPKDDDRFRPHWLDTTKDSKNKPPKSKKRKKAEDDFAILFKDSTGGLDTLSDVEIDIMYDGQEFDDHDDYRVWVEDTDEDVDVDVDATVAAVLASA